MSSLLRIGTRASRLARWQADQVRGALSVLGRPATLVEIHTTGDAAQDVPLHQFGNRAVFTKELDDAVLDRRVDLAVHSLKDLPTTLPDGLALAAVTVREDPRDALVGRGPVAWSDLPKGAVVATSSLRRRAQVLRGRPDLTVVDLRGNVETRLAKLDRTDEWAAVVLAVAGLVRLGLADRIGERLSFDLMLPAPGQGAIAVTARADEQALCSTVREAVHDEVTACCVAAERAFLGRLEGGCQVPVAALGIPMRDGSIRLRGRVVSLGGDRATEGTLSFAGGSERAAEVAGIALAKRLRSEGAGEILAAARNTEV
jgi:hydroxymethylbilane synthase